MHSIASIALLYIGAVGAVPMRSLHTRTPGSITFFTGANYTGTSETVTVPFEQCQMVPETVAGNIGSLKVDAGAYCRITYTAETCTTHGDAFIFPDTDASNLHSFTDPATQQTVDAGSELTSFLCQECTACSA